MDLLYAEQIDFLLNDLKNIKCILFDSEHTKQIVNNLIEYKKLLAANYFYFDYLTNKKRSKINIHAVVVLNSNNLKLLINELVDPRYSEYTILFKNAIDPFALEILAGADRENVVKKVYELNMCGVKIDDFLYQIDLKQMEIVFYALNTSPKIKVFKNIEDFEISQNKTLQFDIPSNLLILERSFDPISPLLCDWFYQGTVAQYLNYKNNTVTINNKTFALTDNFFKTNKFENIDKVSENIKTEVKELEKKRYNINNFQFDDIEGATTQSKIVDTNMSVFKKVLDESMRNQELGEAEIKMLKGNNEDIVLFKKDTKEFLKLKIIESLITTTKPADLDQSIHENVMSKYTTSSYKFSFNNAPDLFSYETPIKKVFRHLVKKKLNANDFYKLTDIKTIKQSENRIYMVYMKNGLTFREYRDLITQAHELNVILYVFTDKMINCDSFLKTLVEK